MNIQQLFSNSFKLEDGSYSNTFTSKELEIIQENNLFKCFLPKNLGGLEMNLFQTLDVIEQCAYINGSLGWMIQIGNGGNYFVTNIQTEIAAKLFSPKNAVLTGSGTPTGIAKPVNGGYEISGISRCSSGSEYATLFTATVYIENSEEIISAIIPRNEVEIINDWDSMGMRLTSTNTTKFDKVFVPDERIFKTSERISHFNIPILDLPFVIYAQAFFIHTIYGLLQRFLDCSHQILNEKGAFWQEKKPERYEAIKQMIKDGNVLINSTKQLTNSQFRSIENEELNNELFHEEVRVSVIANCQRMKQFVHDSFPLFGMDVLNRDHVMNVVYCDMITICQHGLLN